MINADIVTQWSKRRRHNGSVELAACLHLRELATRVPSDQAIVELGAFKGRSTGWLLLGASEGHGAHVTTVDPWTMQKARADYPLGENYSRPEVYQAFKDHMTRIGATTKEHTVKRGYASTVATKWTGPKVGLLFHDAEHSADAVQRDLAAWLPHLAEDAVVVLHDAADPRHGVQAGADSVLTGPEWADRALVPWGRKPNRRGLLVLRRAAPAREAPEPTEEPEPTPTEEYTTEESDPVEERADPEGQDTGEQGSA